MLKVRPHTKSGGGGGGGGPLQVRYTKSGGGAVRLRSDAFVWHTLSLIMNDYNFDRGGCSSTRSTPPPPPPPPLDTPLLSYPHQMQVTKRVN